MHYIFERFGIFRFIIAGPAFVAVATLSGCATNGDDYASVSNRPSVDSSMKEAPNAITLYGMARIYSSQGKVAQASTVLVNIHRQFPDFVPAYNELADLLMQSGRIDDASLELKEGLRRAPSNPILLNNYGVCLLLKGRHSEALQQFETALRSAPYDSRTKANVALARGLNGQDLESMAAYHEILSAQDTDHNMRVIREMRARRETTF